MNGELQKTIHALQSDNAKRAKVAFSQILESISREPKECAVELSAALANELANGDLRTPRLLTLLGLTREPLPEYVHFCHDLLHAQLTASSLLSADTLLGTAAIVARTTPSVLLPDIDTLKAGQKYDIQAAQAQVGVLKILLLISNEVLLENPDNIIANMVRRIWYDCAIFDLMTLGDIVVKRIEDYGWEAPIIELFLDLIECIPVTDNPKSYVGGLLQEAGISKAAEQRQKIAWRAVRVAPPQNLSTGKSAMIEDPQPPMHEARIDEYLAMFAEGNKNNIELARVVIDQMFGDGRVKPPVALSWWVAVTVDALPTFRRRSDISWALVRIIATLRRFGTHLALVPPSLLQRWLETPQLLDEDGTMIVLNLLCQQQPEIVIKKYLYRTVIASDINTPEILMGDCWKALAENNPEVLLAVASRWLYFGFDMNEFSYMLMDVLLKRVRQKSTLIQSMEKNIASVNGMSDNAVGVAHMILEYLKKQVGKDQQL
jgi:hypothetical protein